MKYFLILTIIIITSCSQKTGFEFEPWDIEETSLEQYKSNKDNSVGDYTNYFKENVKYENFRGTLELVFFKERLIHQQFLKSDKTNNVDIKVSVKNILLSKKETDKRTLSSG